MIDNKHLHHLICFIFIIYSLIILYLLLHRSVSPLPLHEYISSTVNFVPLKTIVAYFYQLFIGTMSFKNFTINIFGNILLFIPFGYVFVVLKPELKKSYRIYKLMFCVIVMIESLQLLLKVGCFDVDDILLNMSGVAIGYHMLTSQFQYDWSDK